MRISLEFRPPLKCLLLKPWKNPGTIKIPNWRHLTQNGPWWVTSGVKVSLTNRCWWAWPRSGFTKSIQHTQTGRGWVAAMGDPKPCWCVVSTPLPLFVKRSCLWVWPDTPVRWLEGNLLDYDRHVFCFFLLQNSLVSSQQVIVPTQTGVWELVL